jgi:hypothetical protein
VVVRGLCPDAGGLDRLLVVRELLACELACTGLVRVDIGCLVLTLSGGLVVEHVQESPPARRGRGGDG